MESWRGDRVTFKWVLDWMLPNSIQLHKGERAKWRGFQAGTALECQPHPAKQWGTVWVCGMTSPRTFPPQVAWGEDSA